MERVVSPGIAVSQSFLGDHRRLSNNEFVVSLHSTALRVKTQSEDAGAVVLGGGDLQG